MSKGAILGAVAIVAAVGVSAAGYYSFVSGDFSKVMQRAPSKNEDGPTRSGPLNCGSTDAASLVSKVMKENPPTLLLAAAAPHLVNEYRQNTYGNTEQREKESLCLDAMNKEVEGWYSSVGHPSTSNVRQIPGGDWNVNDCWNGDPNSEADLVRSCKEQRLQWFAHFNACVKPSDIDAARLDVLKKRMVALSQDITYSLENIRTTSVDKDTGAIMCQADLRGTVQNDGSATTGIKFKQEITTDGNLYLTLVK